MAQFESNILLKVQTSGAERAVKKLERSIDKVEEASRGILAVDKKIVAERRALLRLSGEQATKAKKRIRDLTVQKSELALQKRELAQIVRLEKARVASNSRLVGASAASDGGGADASGFALGSALGNARKFRDEIEKARSSLIDSTKDGKAFTSALDDAVAVTSKINDNTSRQAANQSKIEDFTRRVAVQEGQVKRLRGKSGQELDKAKQLLGETKNELKNTKASQRGLVTAAEKYKKLCQFSARPAAAGVTA